MSDPGREPGRTRFRTTLRAVSPLAIPLILFLTLVAPRLPGDVNGDDAYTSFLLDSVRTIADLPGAAGSDVHPPLYYLIELPWGLAGPRTRTFLRLPSLLFVLAGIAAAVAAARRLSGSGAVALLAGALLALNPGMAALACGERMYGLLFLLFSLLLFLDEREGERPGAAPPAVAALLVWTHAWGALAAAVWAMVDAARGRMLRRGRAAPALLAVALVTFVPYTIARGDVYYRYPLFPTPPLVLDRAFVADRLPALALSPFLGAVAEPAFPGRGGLALALAGLLLAAARHDRRSARLALLLALFSAGALATSLAVDDRLKPHYFTFLAPAPILLLAASAGSGRGRPARLAAWALLAAATPAAACAFAFDPEFRNSLSDDLARIVARERPGLVLVEDAPNLTLNLPPAGSHPYGPEVAVEPLRFDGPHPVAGEPSRWRGRTVVLVFNFYRETDRLSLSRDGAPLFPDAAGRTAELLVRPMDGRRMPWRAIAVLRDGEAGR